MASSIKTMTLALRKRMTLAGVASFLAFSPAHSLADASGLEELLRFHAQGDSERVLAKSAALIEELSAKIRWEEFQATLHGSIEMVQDAHATLGLPPSEVRDLPSLLLEEGAKGALQILRKDALRYLRRNSDDLAVVMLVALLAQRSALPLARDVRAITVCGRVDLSEEATELLKVVSLRLPERGVEVELQECESTLNRSSAGESGILVKVSLLQVL